MYRKSFGGLSEMTLCFTKGKNLEYVIAYKIIWDNRKTEPLVYRWLRAIAMLDVIRFPVFAGASFQAFCQYINYKNSF